MKISKYKVTAVSSLLLISASCFADSGLAEAGSLYDQLNPDMQNEEYQQQILNQQQQQTEIMRQQLQLQRQQARGGSQSDGSAGFPSIYDSAN